MPTKDETSEQAAEKYADLRLRKWQLEHDVALRGSMKNAFIAGVEWAEQRREQQFNAIVEEVANAH
jgi:hypothetical protein